MRVRGSSAVLMVSLSLAGSAIVGCGGSKPHSSGSVSGSAARGSTSEGTAATGARTPSAAGTTAGRATGVKYHAGQFCSREYALEYAGQGLVCITGRLHPPEVRYHKGEFCSGRTNALYTRQHLQCVQGRLKAIR